MALDLTGIANRGEFYSHHYLDALLESDLKPLLQGWAAAEKDTPPKRAPNKALNGLAARFFNARTQAADAGLQATEERWRIAHSLHAHLLDALGYPRQPVNLLLDDGTHLPLLHEERRGGRAALWILESGAPEPESDPLLQSPQRIQLQDPSTWDSLAPGSWRELLDKQIFRQDDAPTWVLFLGGDQVLLTHRNKWGKGQALSFDLDALYARRQPAAFRAMAALLHRDALVPTSGVSLHESLDESSHKHAFSVSSDLRSGAEQAIEILGNEASFYLRTVRKKGVLGTSATAEQINAAQLTRECLIYLYRLIFLFYVESRDELGVAPLQSAAYRRGYALESLRALELVPLTTPQAQNGSYIHQTLAKLFGLINQGHGDMAQLDLGQTPSDGFDAAGFRMRGLNSSLFDDARLEYLSKVRFRNAALQQVIQLLSLSQVGKHKQRGRISYASLGINQLGAVYEGLLSYTGFFASEDLIEVANAAENGKADARSYFVPARLRDQYKDGEIVRAPGGARILHTRGTFLYRLAGRDREKSASFYTPEVLTQALVRYTLQERIGKLGEEGSLPADQLLTLKICEPAMGSGAFLNDVIDQLADAYLQRKSAELQRELPAEHYPRQLQRVKAHIAATQCYGVDKNPLAAELGKVSLWLNVLQPGAPAPFFDPRIATGNSLIGARLATYGLDVLHKSSKKAGSNWLDQAPEPVPLSPDGSGLSRAKDRVYHFLLPASGMAPFDSDKVVKALLPEQVATLKAWHKTLNTAWTPAQCQRLMQLSALVDGLWSEHLAARRAALEECTAPTPVWPQPPA